MNHWIYTAFSPQKEYFACQIMGVGYIPWGTPSGRHIQDDFGNLVQSLPSSQFDYEAYGLAWRLMWFMDTQYMYH